MPLISLLLKINPEWTEKRMNRWKRNMETQSWTLGNVITSYHKYWETSSRYRIHSYKSKTIQRFIGKLGRRNSGHLYYSPLFREVKSRNYSKPRKEWESFTFNTLFHVPDKEMETWNHSEWFALALFLKKNGDPQISGVGNYSIVDDKVELNSGTLIGSEKDGPSLPIAIFLTKN